MRTGNGAGEATVRAGAPARSGVSVIAASARADAPAASCGAGSGRICHAMPAASTTDAATPTPTGHRARRQPCPRAPRVVRRGRGVRGGEHARIQRRRRFTVRPDPCQARGERALLGIERHRVGRWRVVVLGHGSLVAGNCRRSLSIA
jgi:hypothetical protein